MGIGKINVLSLYLISYTLNIFSIPSVVSRFFIILLRGHIKKRNIVDKGLLTDLTTEIIA